MSAPEAKAFSFPVRTMAPMVSSSSYAFRAALSSWKSAEERAFRARGRLRVTVLSLRYQRRQQWMQEYGLGGKFRTETDSGLWGGEDQVFIGCCGGCRGVGADDMW